METAGSLLRAERLKKNKTLRDMAESTRISVFNLEAMENDQTNLLPPPAYVRGFIKLYATELDLNPDVVLALYEQSLNELPKTLPPQELHHARGKGGSSAYMAPLVAVAVLLLVLAAYFAYKGKGPSPAFMPTALSEQAAPAAAHLQKAEAVGGPKTAAVERAGLSPDNASTETGKSFTVRFAAQQRCWMRFTVDGTHAFEIVLKPGQTYSVNAVTSLKVRIGNPAGVTAFYNDTPVTIPGQRGKPLEMSFPAAPATRLVQ